MNTNRLLKIFDALADVHNDIPALRKVILAHLLQAAVNSASANSSAKSLREAHEARRRVIAKDEGQKQASPLASVAEIDLPPALSDLPASLFDRLGNITSIEKGRSQIQRTPPGRHPLVVTAEARSSSESYDFEGPAAIVPMVSSTGHGDASLHRLHYQEGKYAVGNILAVVQPICPDLIRARFIYEYLTAFKEELLVARMVGTANVSLTINKLKEVPVPLVSGAVLSRIDELMKLCDELEQRQQARQHASGLLQQSALHHLLAAREPQTFAAAWQRVRDHFHLLHDTPDAIPQLRQAILQLAVQGRLVPQNPKDGKGDETFSLIQKEKIKLGEKRRIETSEQPPQSAAPHEVPSSWKWTTVDDISLKITDGEHLSPKKTSEGMFLLTAKHIRDEGISFTDPQYVSLEDGTRFRIRCGPTRGDVLICSRGTIGRCAVVETDEIFCLMGSVILVRPSSFVIPSFMACFLKTDWAQKKMTGMSGATAVNALYLKDLRYCPIPLPPLAEQKRIVARVEELLRWCDTLEAQLRRTRTLGANLLNSTLHHLLAA